METEVIMKRLLFDCEISQKSKSEFFSATDLMRAGNLWRVQNKLKPLDMNDWFNTKQTKEFIFELEKEYGVVKISGRGRGKHTWIHPFLFLDMALALNPKLKIEVYKWLYDYLIKYRNQSGDSYKKMTGALYNSYSNKQAFPMFIKDVAKQIQLACNTTSWESATEKQLRLRDKIHENISLLSDVLKNSEDAVRIGIVKSLEGES